MVMVSSGTATLHVGGYVLPSVFCDISGLGGGMRSTECRSIVTAVLVGRLKVGVWKNCRRPTTSIRSYWRSTEMSLALRRRSTSTQR